MARLWGSKPTLWLCTRVCVAMITLLLLYTVAQRHSQWEQLDKRELLVSTEIPVEYIDPSSIDLTPLVNSLINSTHTGSEHLFSLLSVTSHSSLSLHKLTLLVYNISNFRDIESSMFPMRYCYCLTNHTNDLTDFTAILLDVMGNSTSYLQELFKSSSILSVSQKNSSDCIYICVMAGKTDRDLSQLWDMDSVTPLFNQTIIEDSHKGNTSYPKLPIEWHYVPSNASLVYTSEHSTVYMTTPASTTTPVPMTTSATATTVPTTTTATAVPATTTTMAIAVPMTTTIRATTVPTRTTTRGTIVPTTTTTRATTVATTTTTRAITVPTRTTTRATTVPTTMTTRTTTVATTTTTRATTVPTRTTTMPTIISTTTTKATTTRVLTKAPERPGCPWRAELAHRGEQREDLRESTPTVSSLKLQPCVFELCKFFSQCLCRGYSYKERFCVDSHRWYERHTLELCQRVKRVSFSKNLKQKCLARMCVKHR